MTLIEQIKAEIERQKKENINYDENGDFASYCDFSAWSALDSVLTFVSDLEKSQIQRKLLEKMELEGEIEKCWKDWLSPSNQPSVEGVLPKSEFMMYAHHFADWQKEKMLNDAVEGYVNYYEDSGGILMAEAQVGCPYHNGDKVKIIIVKED